MTHLESRAIKAPMTNPEIGPFWEAASAGKLMVRRCVSCSKPHFYPRTLCPFCLGPTEWMACSGQGVIYTFSVMRQSEKPYVIAYVKLREGPTMLTNIVDCEEAAVHIGQEVRVVFKPAENGGAIPMFTPA